MSRGRAIAGSPGAAARWRFLLAAVLLLAPAGRAGADPVQAARARLERGLKLYDAQDYRRAVEVLAPLTRDASAPRAVRARAYEALGTAWLILAQEPRARDAFEDLLAIDPGYQLSDPSHSPKLREFFDGVRSGFVPGARAAGEVELEHAAPVRATAGRPVELDASVVRGQAARLAVHFRRQGLLEFAAAEMAPHEGRWAARITPPQELADYPLEYYLEADDATGHALARAGSPEQPLVLPVKGAPPPPKPWFRRGWVWAVAAAVAVVGASLGIGLGVGLAANSAPEGTLGHVDLPERDRGHSPAWKLSISFSF